MGNIVFTLMRHFKNTILIFSTIPLLLNCWSFVSKSYVEKFEFAQSPVKVRTLIYRNDGESFGGAGFFALSPLIPIPIVPLHMLGGHSEFERSSRSCKEWCAKVFVTFDNAGQYMLYPGSTYFTDHSGAQIKGDEILFDDRKSRLSGYQPISLKETDVFVYKVKRDIYQLKTINLIIRNQNSKDIPLIGQISLESQWEYAYLLLYAPIWSEAWGKKKHEPPNFE
jgi:hypothetical protein